MSYFAGNMLDKTLFQSVPERGVTIWEGRKTPEKQWLLNESRHAESPMALPQRSNLLALLNSHEI